MPGADRGHLRQRYTVLQAELGLGNFAHADEPFQNLVRLVAGWFGQAVGKGTAGPKLLHAFKGLGSVAGGDWGRDGLQSPRRGIAFLQHERPHLI